MANGEEDLREKNKGWHQTQSPKYSEWKNFQGREDAEMLQEKSFDWKARKNSFDRTDQTAPICREVLSNHFNCQSALL